MQTWAVPALGGNLAVAGLDSELRQRATRTTFFHQFSPKIAAYGPHRADRIFFDKLGRLATPMSTSGIGETDDFPVTTVPIVQSSVIATEYGNAIEWTEKLETFSAFSLPQLVSMGLKQDQIEGLDRVAFAAYALGRVYYTPLTATTGVFSTTGAPGAVAGSVMTDAHVKDITDNFRTNSVPAHSGGHYMCIAHVLHTRGIKDSTDFLEISKYNNPDTFYDHEIGTFSNVRFVEENNALNAQPGTPPNPAGLAEAIYFGADDVIEAVAVAPQLRLKVPQAYGRDRGMAHYYNGGFSLVWSFNVDGGEEHQIFVSSL